MKDIFDRKCRNVACAKRSVFAGNVPHDKCRWCGTPYGKLELGLDVVTAKADK